ncbi:MAG: PAS domain S-box protein, partial [Proteobacteria bacterium]|nr:PAS domain S-box protein [Pseudomonadota bacterium]
MLNARYRVRRHLISTIATRPNAQLLQQDGAGAFYANTAFYAAFENLTRTIWTRAAGIGAISELIVGEGGRASFSKLQSSADACRYDEADLELRSGAGDTVWWKFTTEPIGGHPGMAVWTVDDRTADHTVEVDRMHEEILLADLLEFLPVGYFSADASGTMQYLNKTLSDWLGVEPRTDGVAPPQFAEFVVIDEEAEEILPAVSDESGLHGAVTLKDSDGEPFPAYLIQSEHQDEAGAFTHSRSLVLREPFIPVVDDGTGRAVIKRFPWLFAEAPVGMVLLDLQGNVTECNRAFLKLLGLHRDGVIGRALGERIVKEDRSNVSGGLSKVVMGTIRATFLDVRMPAAGERELAASLYVSPMHDAENEISGLVVHIIDTTEQKSLEIQFNQSQKMQAVGQLAGGVAHDFNNLLTAMIGFCDLLLGRHGSGDPSFADIMQIKQNANRAANLVRQLLAFSRRQTLQPKTFGVTDSLNDLSNLLRRLIGENIELEIKHGDALDLIRTDPGQFDQVIINLVVNARDAMPGGGVISISTEMMTIETSIQRGHEVVPAGRYVTISVADTGAGIAKEDIGHIFEPFFSTKEIGESTGLGLSTVYGIIRQSDGFIFVDSAMGEGAAFSIYLPAHRAPEQVAGAGTEAIAAPF